MSVTPRLALLMTLPLPLDWRVVADAAHRRSVARRWPHLLGLGLTGVATYNALLYLALRAGTPVNLALLGEWPRPFHGLALALIVAAIAVSSRR